MTLLAGARLGPYEIQTSIGAGGMGEVYRARDSRLGRDVAVKVLPAKRFLVARQLAAANANPAETPLTVVLNWTSALRPR